jgi:hypothetical protein
LPPTTTGGTVSAAFERACPVVQSKPRVQISLAPLASRDSSRAN